MAVSSMALKARTVAGVRSPASHVSRRARLASCVVRAQLPVDTDKATAGTPSTPTQEKGSGLNFVEQAVVGGQYDNPILGIKDESKPNQAPGPIPLGEAMAFAGPAPERINGRLAMLGFIAALGAEVFTGQSVLTQLQAAPGPIAATFVAIAVASLIPMARGVDLRTKSGPLTPQVEIYNGRWAMIGFLALLLTEGIKGGALL